MDHDPNVSPEPFDVAAAWALFPPETQARLGRLMMTLLAARYARGHSEATDLLAAKAEARIMSAIGDLLTGEYDYLRVDDELRLLLPT